MIFYSSVACAAIQPLRFEPHRGQSNSPVLFVARNADGNALFLRNEVIVPLKSAALRIRPLNAQTNSPVEGFNMLPSRSEYYKGTSRQSVEHYSAVRYRNIYPAIDLVYHGRGREIEYDFIVNPGADHSRIRLQFGGADEICETKSGDLVLRVGKDYIIQRAPVAYQDLPTGRRPVQASYRVLPDRSIAFHLGQFDETKPITIDPVLSATYLGGTGADVATATVYDNQGGLWVTGYTFSTDFPNFGDPFSAENKANTDVFVARYHPNGTLDYITYLGGDNDDRATAIAVDQGGAAWITGYTASTNFPTAGGSNQTSNAGVRDIFISRINLAGDRGTGSLWYSTYLGGALTDVANAIAVAPDGNVWIAGYTTSIDFPLIGTSAQAANRGGYDAIVARVDPLAGSNSVIYSTYFGGTSTDVATGITATGNRVLFTGYTMSEDFPTTGDTVQPAYAGRGDAFIASLDSTKVGLDAFDYGTYFGGADTDIAYNIRTDTTGRVYLTGYTMSTDFPVTGTAYQAQKNGDADAFLARLDLSRPAASSLTYSTFYGGNSTDIAYGLAVDNAGRVAISGYTYSNSMPTARPAQAAFGGGFDAFVSYINPNVPGPNGLLFGTYFGGAGTEVAYSVSLDNRGNMAVTGFTTSAEGISAGPDPVQQSSAGFSDGFVAKYALCDIPGVCAQ
ncbi:MAG: SBBP repeat-containing protein [Bryobacterales bacterium]|nr:SBBP repeat-containing protein [Bryobacterales bacterium]